MKPFAPLSFVLALPIFPCGWASTPFSRLGYLRLGVSPPWKDAIKKAVFAAFVAVGILMFGCGGGGGGGTDNTGNTSTNTGNTPPDTSIVVGEKISISGTLDGLTLVSFSPDRAGQFTVAPKEGLKGKPALSAPCKKAHAAASIVDNIVAVSPDKSYVFASRAGNSFSLSLARNKQYIVVLLNGANVVAYYRADDTTGMDAFPISQSSTDIDVGTVFVSGGVAQGTISSSSLLQNLGLAQAVASVLGVMDEGMIRFSNVDVDGNGVIDTEENKWFNLKIGYQFRPTENYDDLFTNFSSRENAIFSFYFYVYEGAGDNTQDWGAEYSSWDWQNAKLIPPSPITTRLGNTLTELPYTGGGGTNFMGDPDRYVSPTQPPEGTYKISIPLSTGGTKTLTFNNVKSFDMTGAGVNYVYVPEVKLTKDSGGKITTIEWRWWKKAAGVWVQPSNEELSAVWYGAAYFISNDSGSSQWTDMPMTATGNISLNPPVQPSMTNPKSFQIGAQDRGGYSYSFDWWEQGFIPNKPN